MVKKHVIMGGAHAGKTTLVEALGRRGFHTVEEPARLLIEKGLRGEGPLPWKDMHAFIDVCLTTQVEFEDAIPHDESHAFLDRGLPDYLAYSRLAGKEVSQEFQELIRAYRYDTVFLLDLVPGYVQDEVRREPYEMVLETHRLIEEAFRDCGYEPIRVPFMSIDERAELVLGITTTS